MKTRPHTSKINYKQITNNNHNITELEHAELLTGRKVGRTRVLALAPLPIKRIHDRWIGDYAHAAVELLASLDTEDE
jgi:hypothetical protein